MLLTGNIVLVTGGGSGIGRGLAVALHERGNRVVIAGRRVELLHAVAAENPGIEYLPVDVAQTDKLGAFADAVMAHYPDLNVVVNNAGIMPVEGLTEPGTSMAIVSTNLLGPIVLTSLLLPRLRANSHAAVINVTSALAFVPLADIATYSATKAGMHSYTESLRFQLRDSGIQVIEIPPPRVNTDSPGSLTSDPHTMELDEFIAETMSRLETQPEAGEIVVDAARALRYAERNGTYAEQFAKVNP
jgi:uncharacterized oxidoreductase